MTIPTPFPPHVMRHSAGVSVLERSSETMRITGLGGETVWLQNGQLYDDAGQRVEPPHWFKGEFDKLSKNMKKVHVLGDRAPDLKAEAQAIEYDSEETLDGMNKSSLLKVAELEGVDVSPNETKGVILEKILDNRKQIFDSN